MTVPKRDGRRRLRAAGDARHRQAAPRQGRSSARDFEFLKPRSRTRTPKVTIPSPTMLHFRGGRAGDQQRRLSRPRARSSPTSPRPTAPRSPRSPPPAAATSSSTTPTSPICATRRCASGARSARRRSRRAAAPLRRADQRARSRDRPADMTVVHPPVPRQLPQRLGRRGRLRAGRRGAVQRARRRRLLPRVRRRALRRLRAAALRAQGQDRRARPGHHQARRSSRPRTSCKRRIDEAAALRAARPAALSPQCGFSSTVHGNVITVEAQCAKLRLVVEIAREVWGEL